MQNLKPPRLSQRKRNTGSRPIQREYRTWKRMEVEEINQCNTELMQGRHPRGQQLLFGDHFSIIPSCLACKTNYSGIKLKWAA